ncbi:hypothetical protein KM043_016756 [Ampulex compressa]|nr:hypothetical protein KM043_016756 [Ampulex compressa]
MRRSWGRFIQGRGPALAKNTILHEAPRLLPPRPPFEDGPATAIDESDIQKLRGTGGIPERQAEKRDEEKTRTWSRPYTSSGPVICLHGDRPKPPGAFPSELFTGTVSGRGRCHRSRTGPG